MVAFRSEDTGIFTQRTGMAKIKRETSICSKYQLRRERDEYIIQYYSGSAELYLRILVIGDHYLRCLCDVRSARCF